MLTFGSSRIRTRLFRMAGVGCGAFVGGRALGGRALSTNEAPHGCAGPRFDAWLRRAAAIGQRRSYIVRDAAAMSSWRTDGEALRRARSNSRALRRLRIRVLMLFTVSSQTSFIQKYTGSTERLPVLCRRVANITPIYMGVHLRII